MNRKEAIAIIERALPTADDATLTAAAEILLAGEHGASDLPRELTDAERARLADARSDFAHGRRMSLTESRAYIEDALARRRAPPRGV